MATLASPTTVLMSPSSSSVQERRKKKPYKELTLQEKVELIRLAEENAGMSQASIAEKYSIAKSNVCRILQRKAEYLRAFESAGFAGSRKRKLKGDVHAVVTSVPTSSLPASSHSLPRPVMPAPSPTFIHTPKPSLPPSALSSTPSNETLRAHMYKQHGISRMFMCRCCNWAFPDKTSLHMHLQAKEEGKAVSVPVIGKGLPPGVAAPSAFQPLLPLNNNSLALSNANLAGLAPPLGGFFPMASEDMLAKLRERLMLSSLLAQSSSIPNGVGLAAAWLSSMPRGPLPDLLEASQNEKSAAEEEEEEEEVNVEKDGDSDVDDKMEIAVDVLEKSDEKNTEEEKVTAHSPRCGSGSSRSASAASPRLFHKSSTPLHHLNVCDSGHASDVSHVSPSETHSSVSPSGCFDCSVAKGKLAAAERQCRLLEAHSASLQANSLRFSTRVSELEATSAELEKDLRTERARAETLTLELRALRDEHARIVEGLQKGSLRVDAPLTV